jgi:serine/threonine protein kinase/tetratricopeptide (TPR) repeat protein
MKDTLPVRVRLGAFELDLRAGELRLAGVAAEAEGGNRVLLPEQPFRLLLMLVERAGAIVTREEIKKKFWPNDTIVEFDHSINVAIGKLRKALGDSGDEPKYIETIPRRGYRLIVPVEWLDAVGSSDQGAPSFRPPLAKGWETSSGLISKKVSHYRVLEVIGGGGMGLVYKAEDLKLGRRVALKFLPEELASDAVALQRFEREAQTASSLNHPNICTIYEIEEHEGQPFIVMELLEGETLRDRLAASADKALPLDELLDIAIQICDGLQAAHQKGIIHRDIKPANIFLMAPGQVKILDFGLAKLVSAGEKEQAAAAEQTQAGEDLKGHGFSRAVPAPPLPPNGLQPATDFHLTRTGSEMGTAGYMSPEQVRGEKLDARTDLFSFGLVLYEIATGQRAFSGETAEVVHNAILNNSPVPVRDLNSTLPSKLVSTIDKALEKDRERRYQSAAEIRSDLDAVSGDKRDPHRPPWKWYATAALVGVIAVGGWLYWRSRNTLRLTATDTVVLADIANGTSDAVFTEALPLAQSLDLAQTPYLNVLTDDKVRGTLKLLNHSEDARITPELAREVCLRTNSKAYLEGHIADNGNHYLIELRAVNCQTGRPVARIERDRANRNEVINALGAADTELRRRLGEPEASLHKFNKPLDEAMSSSPEAMQALGEGQRAWSAKGSAAGLPHFKRAIELDPNFAVVYVNIGAAYLDVGETALAIKNEKKAYDLRERTSAVFQLAIEALYYSIATGELEKASQSYAQWIEAFPMDPRPHGNFTAALKTLGRYERSAAEAREAIRLGTGLTAYYDLMAACIYMGQMDQAKATFEETRVRKLDDWMLRSLRYTLAFLEGDNKTMEEQLTWAMGKPGIEDQFLSLQSGTKAYYGRINGARELTRRAMESAKHANALETAETWRVDQALRETEVGNSRQAREMAAEALAATSGRDARTGSALVLARAGNVKWAQTLMEGLNREFSQDTMMQNYWIPTIQSAIELDNNPARAIEILKSAAPYELASPSPVSSLYPAYLRGLANLKIGQGYQAAIEFQKMLDHPGIVGNYLTGALAHLQLGRAQVMMGNKAAARRSYQDFLALWKDADPDIPIYQQAKAEYAKLQ